MKLSKITGHEIRTSSLIFGLCLVFHLVLTFAYPVTEMAPGDGLAYLSFAAGIAEGRGYASEIEPWVADRPPLYPFLLSLVLRTAGLNRMVVFLLQSFVFSLAAGLFYLSCCRLLGRRVGFLAGIFFALFPHFGLYTNNILTESLYLAFLVFLMSVLMLPRRLRLWHCATAGLLLGLFILLRREAILIGGMLLLVLLLIRFWGRWRRILPCFLGVAVLAVLVVSPWVIRNWTLLGEPVLSSATGLNLMVCNNPLASGAYTLPPQDWPKPDPPVVVLHSEETVDQSLPCFRVAPEDEAFGGRVFHCYFMIELAYNQALKTRVLAWVMEHPGEVLLLLGRKLAALFSPANNVFLDVVDLVLIPLYIAGLVRVVRGRENWLKVLLVSGGILLTQLVITLVFCGGYRYRVILYPGMLLLAVFALPEPWVNRMARWPVLRNLMDGSGDAEEAD